MGNKKIYFFYFFFLILRTGHAQNLVPNGNFEGFSFCPNSLSQITRANNWLQPTGGNPDYFNACASGNTIISFINTFGYQAAHSGNGYAGLYTYQLGINYKEYIQVELTDSLISGRKYHFEMYVSLADGSCQTSSIGAYFSGPQITQASSANFNFIPQIASGLIADKTGWTKVSGLYSASGGEKYLTIGNFQNPTAVLNASLPCAGAYSYIYIDDVDLEDSCTTRIHINDTAICSASAPLILKAFTVTQPVNTHYLWNTADTTPSIQINQTGLYWVTISDPSCLYTDTVIVFDSTITVSLGPDSFLCGSNPIQLSASHHLGDHFLWQNNSTDTFLTVNNPGSYIVRVSNKYCSNSDTIKISYTLPPNILGNDIHSCNNSLFPLRLSATSANADHYLWNNNSTDSFIITNDTGLFWVAMNKNSCVLRDSVQVSNTNLAKPDLGPDTSLCTGSNLTLHANVVSDSYTWLYNNTFMGTSLLPSFNATNAGLYIVEIDKANCKTRDTVLVSFRSKPQVTLGNDTLLCYNTTLLLEANSNLNGLSYKWQNGDTVSHFNVTSAGLYWIEANNGGCKNTDSITINYENQIIVTLGNDTSLCQGQVLHLSANGSGGATNFLWNTNAVTNFINVSLPGIYWSEASKGYCKARDSINVTFKQNPLVNIGNDTTVCANIILTLKATNTNAVFLWNTGDTTNTTHTSAQGPYWVKVTKNLCSSFDTMNLYTVTPPSLFLGNDTTLCGNSTMTLNAYIFGANYLWQDGSTSSNFKVTDEGEYLVKVSKGICKIKDSVHVSYMAKPGVILGPDTAYCFNQPVILSAASSFADTYLWQDGSTSSSFIAHNPGNYWVTVTINVCSATDSVILKQDSSPVVNLGTVNKLCKEDSLTLVAGTDTSNRYLWNDQSTSETKKAKAPGLFSVVVTNLRGCYSSDSIMLDTFASPVVWLGNDTSFCEGSTFEINAGNQFKSYLWQDGSGGDSVIARKAGIYFVMAKDLNNCSAIDSIKLSVNQKPQINLIKSLTICEPDTFIKPEGNFISYLWQDGTTSSSFRITDYGTYSVTVTDSNYCSNDASIQVVSNCAGTLYVPNAFTPNEDGINEAFIPVIRNVQSCNIQIYNRWGQLIFESGDMKKGWDGTFKNEKVQTDVYAYVINYVGMDGNAYKKNGTITLLK